MMNVVFRVDGGKEIGTGHVMRCAVLARQIIKQGGSVTFICNSSTKQLEKIITDAGCKVLYLPNEILAPEPDVLMTKEQSKLDADATKLLLQDLGKVDWLVIDHYGLEVVFENILRADVENIMVIDDLENRTHNCELLLDQNFYTNPKDKYKKLLPGNCTRLIGPRYALLREEFANVKKYVVKKKVERILISFGGSDPKNYTGMVLKILNDKEYQHIAIDVVLGAASNYKEEIKAICDKNKNFTLHVQIDYMSRLMAEADLFIGAGGTTSWERLAIGLPGIVIAIAQNQIAVSKELEKAGLVIYLGEGKNFDKEKFINCLSNAFENYEWRESVSAIGRGIVDGRGAKRVTSHLIAQQVKLRPAQKDDIKNIYEWRNAPAIRQFSHNNNEITFASHEEWCNKTFVSGERDLLIAELDGNALGVIRFDYEEKVAVISLYLVPENFGKGFGLVLLLAAQKWLQQNRPNIKTIKAEVKKENIPSCKIFADSGFVNKKKIDNLFCLEKEMVA